MSSGRSENHGQIYDYKPPPWAGCLRVVPKSRVKLTMTPTPIHTWKLPGVPDGFNVSIKREDMIGCTLSGNKVRKLEFILADAIDQGCDCVVTIGAYLSNHVRATVMAAKEMGLQSHVLIFNMGPEMNKAYKANYTMSRMMGAKFITFPYKPEEDVHVTLKYIQDKMDVYCSKLRKEGHKPYPIPVGGSSTIGAWGYIDGFKEMMEQGILDNFDDIVVTVGSCGTLCGLAIANYLTKSSLKIHGISVHDTEESILSHIDHELQTLGIEGPRASELVDVTTDYIGAGVGESADELKLIVSVTSETGIPIDPVFNAKSVKGMLTEMRLHPERFKGNRTLYIHSGGVYNLFTDDIDKECQQNEVTSQTFSFQDIIN